MGRVADISNYTEAEILLWERIKGIQENKVFRTARGLAFRIEIKGNELFVDRKVKSITRSSVNMAYQKWLRDQNCGPKALGVFGASYLWGIFNQLGEEESDAV